MVENAYILLLESIQEDIKKKGIQQTLIAKKIGVSPTSLTYYLKAENNIKFIQFYELLRMVYDQDYYVIINNLMQFVKVTPKRDNLMECLEWSSSRGEQELFHLALSIEKKHKNGNETTEVYSLLMARNKNEIDPITMLEKVDKLKIKGVKQFEIEVLLSILNLYIYLDLKKYNIITLLAKSTLNIIEKLKKGFIKSAFIIRVQEMLAISLMKDGKIDESKKVASKIISSADEKIFPLPISSMLSLMSELYVFSDFEKSIWYIQRALKMFDDLDLKNYTNRRNMLRSTNDFVRIVNFQYQGLFLEDKSEQAHLLAKTGHYQEALQILENLESKGRLSPFQLYYKALATQNLADYKRAEREFYRSGDFYYCKLVDI